MSTDVYVPACVVVILVMGSRLLMPFHPVAGCAGLLLAAVIANLLYERQPVSV